MLQVRARAQTAACESGPVLSDLCGLRGCGSFHALLSYHVFPPPHPLFWVWGVGDALCPWLGVARPNFPPSPLDLGRSEDRPNFPSSLLDLGRSEVRPNFPPEGWELGRADGEYCISDSLYDVTCALPRCGGCDFSIDIKLLKCAVRIKDKSQRPKDCLCSCMVANQ